MKRILSIALAVLMLTVICASALAAPIQLSSADADNQISFIYSKLSAMKQNEAKKAWNYAVTDLDRNGQLELLAASEHDSTHSTTLMVWEVNKAVDTMVKCVVQVEDDESFPDIMDEAADTFFDDKTDTWHYLFFDNIVLSDQDAYSLKCSVTLKDRTLSYEQYAVMHVRTENGSQIVTYTDMDGNVLTEDAFNAAGTAAFPQQNRSSTNFDWFAYDEVSLTRLADSYAIFIGEKQPVKPAPSGKPAPGAQFLMITKNPTNEYHSAGETAWFVAGANTWDSLTWTFVSPNGSEDSPEDFLSGSGASINGVSGTTLSISNLETWMDGWGVYCTFRYQGQTARTSTAWLSVSDNPSPTPGVMSGTVTDAMMSTVTIQLDNGTTIQPLRDNVVVSGELSVGCRCDVYYQGDQPTTDNVTYVYIYGNNPPSYGSMGGSISDATMNFATIDLDGGGSVTVSQDIVNMVYGSMVLGCRCNVLYYGDSPSSDNVYEVDVYGSDPDPEPPQPPEPPEPVINTASGSIVDTSMNDITVALDQGGTVNVNMSLVQVVYGDITIGSEADVNYYGDYPTSDNVVSVDVYGNSDDDSGDNDNGGGWDPDDNVDGDSDWEDSDNG